MPASSLWDLRDLARPLGPFRIRRRRSPTFRRTRAWPSSTLVLSFRVGRSFSGPVGPKENWKGSNSVRMIGRMLGTSDRSGWSSFRGRCSGPDLSRPESHLSGIHQAFFSFPLIFGPSEGVYLNSDVRA